MTRAALAVWFTSMSLWVGGLASISFAVAPAAFAQSPSRQVAGAIVGASLRAFGRAELVLGAVATVCAAWLARGAGRWEKARAVLTLVMLAVAAAYVFWVYPEAGAARGVDGARFDVLHRWSVRLVGVNLLVGTAQIVVSAARVKPVHGA